MLTLRRRSSAARALLASVALLTTATLPIARLLGQVNAAAAEWSAVDAAMGRGRAASEVNPVIRTLRAHGIEVTSLHNHMLTDEPRLFFMHFWANADAATLAAGLRAALGQMAVAAPRAP